MKILLLVDSFPPEIKSAGILYFQLAKELTNRGHRVTVVTPFPRYYLGTQNSPVRYHRPVLFHREYLEGIQVIRVWDIPFAGRNMFKRGLDALLLPVVSLIGCLRAGRPDVVLIYSPPLTLGLTGLFLSRLRGIPFVFNVQDIYPQTLIDLGLLKNGLLIRIFEAIERIVYAQASRIVVHSDSNRAHLVEQKSQPQDKVVVIHNWVDTGVSRRSKRSNTFREDHQLGNKFVVSYAGTMGYAQDLGIVIEAADLLRSRDDVLFLLIGDGVRKAEWEEKVVALQCSNVQFLPLQPKEVYPSILGASDVGLVLLSEQIRTPAVPGKLQNIMASGRPVIASVGPGSDVRRIVEEARCGYIVEPGNGQMLATLVCKLHDDPGLAADLGKNGRAYAEKHFSLFSSAALYEQLFQGLIERSHSVMDDR